MTPLPQKAALSGDPIATPQKAALSGDPVVKFENPARLLELAPEETLRRIGLTEDSVLCDIGAGTGVFALPAAALTHGTVYAIDISDDMLAIIARKAAQAGISNIQCVKVTDAGFGVAPGTADIVLMCSMLHGMPDMPQFIKDAAALLKPGGRLAIIEFHYHETPMGPPVSRRILPADLDAMAAAAGLCPADSFILGENFYCAVYEN